MIAKKLIECARALARKYPDEKGGADVLIGAVERIDREFEGEQRLKLLSEAREALERHIERARATVQTKKALEELRQSQASLQEAMKRLTEVAQQAVAGATQRKLGNSWASTPLQKKVTWH